MRWRHTVGGILAAHWDQTKSLNLNGHQLKHLHMMSRCHTPSLGGSLEECHDCHHQHYIYFSCRNRHCPSCGSSKRDEWTERQQSYLLDTHYYHVVFTIPSELNKMCMYAPRIMYDLLFRASWKTLETFASDRQYLGAQIGMTAVLHTWSQNMGLHPHLHCIVPGGGLTKNGQWKSTRSKGKYLFPIKAIREVFKGIFMSELRKLSKIGAIELPYEWKETLYRKRWVVYAKRPFADANCVIEYLGRYTHKVAISNHRLISYDENSVTFKWKNYRNAAKVEVMELSTQEFLRRLGLHILPHKFVRIRHFGILSFHGRTKVIPEIQQAQGYKPTLKRMYPPLPAKLQECPKCKSKRIITYTLFPVKPRSP